MPSGRLSCCAVNCGNRPWAYIYCELVWEVGEKGGGVLVTCIWGLTGKEHVLSLENSLCKQELCILKLFIINMMLHEMQNM